MPWDLVHAITHANRVLDWQENLMKDEIPPEWMWPLDDEIANWFRKVKEDRDAKYGGKSNDDDESSPMMGNELAEGLRK